MAEYEQQQRRVCEIIICGGSRYYPSEDLCISRFQRTQGHS